MKNSTCKYCDKPIYWWDDEWGGDWYHTHSQSVYAKRGYITHVAEPKFNNITETEEGQD